jgi:hypothetical protein
MLNRVSLENLIVCLVSQEISPLLRKQKTYFCLHKNPLRSVLSQINPIHTPNPIYLSILL